MNLPEFETRLAELQAAEEAARHAYVNSGNRTGGNGPAQHLGLTHERARAKTLEFIAEHAPAEYFIKEAKRELRNATAALLDLQERITAKGSQPGGHERAARRRVHDAEKRLAQLELTT